MKLLRSIMTASAMILTVASAFAQDNAADKAGKKSIYVVNGKRAEPFDPEIADMSVFKTVGGNAAKIAKLAADAGISEQELTENDVVILKSKKPMYVAKVGQGVDYTGTIWCEGSYLPNIYIMTQQGKTDADGKFTLKTRYGTIGYIAADGFEGTDIKFTEDRRNKITLYPQGIETPKDNTSEKKPMYNIVNGEYVRMFNINNYEPDEIISVKHIWERDDEVADILAKSHIKPKFIEQNGAAVITLRDGVQLAKPNTHAAYTLEVRDTEGNPVSGARIFIERTHTDFLGKFAITADCGTKAIAIYRNNMLKVKRFEFGATPDISINLERNPNHSKPDNAPVVMADVMPRYMEGDLGTFHNWVMSNITYPDKVYSRGIQGRVLVAFVVGLDGKVEDIEIIESPHEALSKEVIRIMNRSGKWTPGLNAGLPARVRFLIPVDFTINRNR